MHCFRQVLKIAIYLNYGHYLKNISLLITRNVSKIYTKSKSQQIPIKKQILTIKSEISPVLI